MSFSTSRNEDQLNKIKARQEWGEGEERTSFHSNKKTKGVFSLPFA